MMLDVKFVVVYGTVFALTLLARLLLRPTDGPCIHHHFDEQGSCIFCDAPED